jgi:hypothetical protein
MHPVLASEVSGRPDFYRETTLLGVAFAITKRCKSIGLSFERAFATNQP